MFLPNILTSSLCNFSLPVCVVPLLGSLGIAAKEITTLVMKSRVQEKEDVSCHWNFFDCLCFSCIVIASLSGGRYLIRFISYFYIINDSRERNMEKETLCCHVTYHLCWQRNWVCLHHFWRPWRKLLTSMVLWEEAGPPGITHSLLSRIYTVLGTEVCFPACPVPSPQSH